MGPTFLTTALRLDKKKKIDLLWFDIKCCGERILPSLMLCSTDLVEILMVLITQYRSGPIMCSGDDHQRWSSNHRDDHQTWNNILYKNFLIINVFINKPFYIPWFQSHKKNRRLARALAFQAARTPRTPGPGPRSGAHREPRTVTVAPAVTPSSLLSPLLHWIPLSREAGLGAGPPPANPQA